MSDVDNGRMTEQEALALIHGHSEDDWHECIRQGSEVAVTPRSHSPRARTVDLMTW
jgi:hypothetical protein